MSPVRAQGLLRRLARLMPPQRGWALAGLVVLMFIIPVTVHNLQEIYRSQKDFVVGLAFSAASFCFGRAYSRRSEQEAIHLVQSPTPEVERALREETFAWLARRGVFAESSVLGRNLEAACERLGEFYDLQAGHAGFHQTMPVLKVAISDVERARRNVVALDLMLDPDRQDRHEGMPEGVRLRLLSAGRDLAAANDRRDKVHTWLLDALPPEEQEAMPLFLVMTSDVLKALRGLDAALNNDTGQALAEQLTVVRDFLLVAAERTEELAQLLGVLRLPPPQIFRVMDADIRHASQGISGILAAGARPDVPGPRRPKPEAAG
ncbi:hypothetical protein [Longispora albida]|uniref:hypothetical protein n=1 Tax=Longispora albida TaxID=203523 RepID=UPI00039A3868|nr:hypothetical protein [Longispora albida]